MGFVGVGIGLEIGAVDGIGTGLDRHLNGNWIGEGIGRSETANVGSAVLIVFFDQIVFAGRLFFTCVKKDYA